MLLQKNPLTVVGTLSQCWLFAYRTHPDMLQQLLPRPLELVTHAGHAFWNIVVSRIDAMRPKHFPALVGMSYWHVAYRLYVRLPQTSGPAIEGLYFVRSDCDKALMALAGNILTDFRFHTASLRLTEHNGALDIWLNSPDAPAHARLLRSVAPQVASDSAFDSLEEAATFLKYKPYGISVDDAGNTNVVHITRQERAWHSRLVAVEAAHWAFFDEKEVQLEICYEVEPIVYQWDRGRTYRALHLS